MTRRRLGSVFWQLSLAGMLTGAALPVSAQVLAAPEGPAAARVPVQADTLPGLWRLGRNAAGLAAAGPAAPSRLGLRADARAGALRRVQAPARTGGGRVETEGQRAFGGEVVARGVFAFGRRAEAGRRWGNTANPTGRSPYVWADSAGGDWLRDGLAAEVAVALPSPGAGIRPGLRADYAAEQGARRDDPRPLFRRRALMLAPGLARRLGGGLSAGLVAEAAFEREENEVGFFAGDDPLVFRLRGLGTFDQTALVRAQRATVGRTLGATAQLAGEAGRTRWAVAAGGAAHAAETRDGVATPAFGGSVRGRAAHARAALRQAGARGGAEAALDVRADRLRGTDPVFRAVNTVDERAHAEVALAHWRGAASPAGARAALGLKVGAERLVRRDVATQTRWAVTALAARADARSLLPGGFDTSGRLIARAPLAAAYAADRPTTLTPVLVRPDFDLHAAPSLDAELGLGAVRTLRSGRAVRVALRGGTAAGWPAGRFATRPFLLLSLDLFG
ncbi:MAG: DUF6850 family outer membrane beta-barrel protein [Rubricoccaceae bacterium]